ncbi:transglycosylase SLT domain-containing protein [Roseixanthobacter pseudopolyaromaticivorans]|uniref:transglycosylase SLT domain-containing protein n=1 Tax=Xanthobacteraceae TaxID=335928 RepID=UPI0037268A33
MAETDLTLLDPNQDQTVSAGPALSPPELDLPDVHGASVAAPSTPPDLSLPDTSDAASALPAPMQPAPQTPPAPAESPPATGKLATGRATRINQSNPGAAKVIETFAAKHGVDPDVLKVLADIESSGNPSAVTGSYKGLFQMSDEEMGKYGRGRSAFDIEANTEAAILSMKDKAAAFQKRFGRAPTPTEFYLGHQQGDGGLEQHLANPNRPAWQSMYATGEGKRRGEKWARDAIWGNIPTDMRQLFPGGVDTVTSAQFAAVWAQKVQGIPYAQALGKAQGGTFGTGSLSGGGNDYNAPVQPFADTSPSFAPAGTQEAAVEQNKLQHPTDDPGVWQMVQAAASETITARIFQQTQEFIPDPAYVPTAEEVAVRKQGLPEKFHDSLIGVSAEHSNYLTNLARQQATNEQTLADGGWTGTGINVLTTMLDPPTLALGIASGGAGSALGGAMKLGRVGQRLIAAAANAAGNVATEALLDASGKTSTASDYLGAASFGALFGFALGPIARNPATADIAAAGIRRTREFQTGLASGDLGAAINTGNTLQFSTHDLAKLADADVPSTAIETGRIDMAGRVGRSENPAARAIGGALLTDSVGVRDADGLHATNPIAADQDKARLVAGYRTRVSTVAAPSFKEWADAQGVPWWKRSSFSKAWKDFGEEVGSYIRDDLPDASGRYSPQAIRVGDTMRESYRQQLKDNQDPRWREGGGGRPLPGLEQVSSDMFYSPRVYSLHKLDQLASRVGDMKVVQLFEGAIRSRNPHLSDDLVGRIAQGMYKNHRARGFGLQERGMMLRNGAEPNLLKAHLMEDIGLPEADADRAVSIITAERPGVPFAKARFDLDEKFELPDGTKFSDILETNAFALHENYTSSAQAWAALGRVRITDAAGSAIVDGIRSVNEFEQLLDVVRARGVGTQTKAQTDRDIAILREAFDRIRGVPHDAAGSTWDKSLELLRNVNLFRLGGNFGIAQLGDIGGLPAIAGIRAMLQHMPDFRRIVDGGVLTRGSELGKELQAVFGFGADDLRGLTQHVREEMLLGRAELDPKGSRLDMALDASRRASEFVMQASGLQYLTAVQQVWAGKLIAQKFSDLASRVAGNATLSSATLNRMKFLGLDDAMLGRVLREVGTHREVVGGTFGERINRMNLDNWTDGEARRAFEGAVFRLARKAIQENDIGLQTPWSRSPLFRSVMQLRQFTLTAWHNNTLHNLNMRDGESIGHLVASTFAAGLVYAGQVRLQAATEADPEKFLRDRMKPGAFGAAVFQRTAASSLIPTIVDTALGPVADPIFNYRTSGQPSKLISGIPTVSLWDDLQTAGQALAFPNYDGRERSQQEYKAMLRVFTNSLPATALFSTMISGAPARAPKSRDGHSIPDIIMNSVD